MNKSIEEIKQIINSYDGLELDRIDVELLQEVVDYVNELEKENTNLKQTLNEIKELVNNLKDDYDSFDYDIFKEHKETILQIIDKVGGNE